MEQPLGRGSGAQFREGRTVKPGDLVCLKSSLYVPGDNHGRVFMLIEEFYKKLYGRLGYPKAKVIEMGTGEVHEFPKVNVEPWNG